MLQGGGRMGVGDEGGSGWMGLGTPLLGTWDTSEMCVVY